MEDDLNMANKYYKLTMWEGVRKKKGIRNLSSCGYMRGHFSEERSVS